MSGADPVQDVLHIANLPASALDAAAEFHRLHLPRLREMLRGTADSQVIVLPPAPRDHADWRRAAARDLARHAAPIRVNLVVGVEGTALDEVLGFLANAPGVTGQLLHLAD